MIRQPWLVLVSGLFLLLALLMAGERLLFASTSVLATGEVVEIQSWNERCGRTRGTTGRRTCTEFRAIVAFEAEGADYTMRLPAGRANGSDQPVREADLAKGDFVRLRYSTLWPSWAFVDSTDAIWGFPGGLALASALFLGGAFVDPRWFRRR